MKTIVTSSVALLLFLVAITQCMSLSSTPYENPRAPKSITRFPHIGNSNYNSHHNYRPRVNATNKSKKKSKLKLPLTQHQTQTLMKRSSKNYEEKRRQQPLQRNEKMKQTPAQDKLFFPPYVFPFWGLPYGIYSSGGGLFHPGIFPFVPGAPGFPPFDGIFGSPWGPGKFPGPGPTPFKGPAPNGYFPPPPQTYGKSKGKGKGKYKGKKEKKVYSTTEMPTTTYGKDNSTMTYEKPMENYNNQTQNYPPVRPEYPNNSTQPPPAIYGQNMNYPVYNQPEQPSYNQPENYNAPMLQIPMQTYPYNEMPYNEKPGETNNQNNYNTPNTHYENPQNYNAPYIDMQIYNNAKPYQEQMIPNYEQPNQESYQYDPIQSNPYPAEYPTPMMSNQQAPNYNNFNQPPPPTNMYSNNNYQQPYLIPQVYQEQSQMQTPNYNSNISQNPQHRSPY